jgi:hypothetical protein
MVFESFTGVGSGVRAYYFSDVVLASSSPICFAGISSHGRLLAQLCRKGPERAHCSFTIQAGGDVSRVQWYSVDDLRTLPDLAFNHIRLLRMALHQMFTSKYQSALGLQAVATSCQCEIETSPGQRCSNTAYWCYNGMPVCPRHIQVVVEAQGAHSLKRATERIGG